MGSSAYVASGHGADDPGAVANGLKERDANSAIATRLVKRLRDHKLKVHTDLERGNLRASSEIADARKRGDVALFLGLHHNAAAPSARGLEVFKTGRTRSPRFATALHAELLAELRKLDPSWKDRGVKAKGTRAESIVVKSPGASALVEFAFLTNKLDAKIVKGKRYAAAMAEALCRATIATLRHEKLTTVTYRAPATKPATKTPPKPPAPKPERFIVRHGSGAGHGTFTSETEAIDRWRRLRKAGKGGSITAT